MITQFHRLLKKIAEENEKVFQGSVLKAHTINQPQDGQMAKLRVGKPDSNPVLNPRLTTRPCQGPTVKRVLASQ
jgi:hypothetical protein